MEIIIATIAVGSAAAYGFIKKKQKKEAEVLFRNQVPIFIEKVLKDQIVFQKTTKTGLITNQFLGKEGDHAIYVAVSASQLTFEYKQMNGKRKRIIYRYVFDRKRKIGQIVEMDENFVLVQDVLFRKLEKKMLEYDWENPMAYYAQETVDRLTKPKKLFGTLLNKNEIPPQILHLMQEIEGNYAVIKEEADLFFGAEERHNLERLFYKDYENLKKSYQNLTERNEEEDQNMVRSLTSILEKMKKDAEKLQFARKKEFEKTVKVIKKRD